MTNRWLYVCACVIAGVTALICGLLVPVHLRAVNDCVLQRAGQNTPDLAGQGLALLNGQNLGAAQLLLKAAQMENLPGREKLALAVTNFARLHPGWTVWGGDRESQAARLFESDSRLPVSGLEPFTDFAVRQENRDLLLELLGDSAKPGVQSLLRCRTLDNTVLFPPSHSASGQAFDTAVGICGFLLEDGRLSAGLSNSVSKLALAANLGAGSQPLEEVLMDLMSLGQRFNWNQLVAFVGRVDDAATLDALANQVRNAGGQLPVLFSAVVVSGRPAAVVKYLAGAGKDGMPDLAASLQFGAGGVNEFLQRRQHLYHTDFFLPAAAELSLRQPEVAMALKWFCYLLGGFLFAAALHFARPAVSSLERPLQVRGFHLAREFLFALGFLLVVVLLSEPFLAQDNRKETFSIQLHVPTVGNTVLAEFARAHPKVMNNMILLTLLLFFVLQGLIYIACLVKLAEIRRQNVPPRIKLKLLENEDHLFDAGLYLGFVGTIVSLILVSMGVIKFSLMAAYSSTSFGIVFVCFFKIFHLRPARRRLLLEAEAIEPSAPPAAVPAPVA